MPKKASRKHFQQRLNEMVDTLRDEIISGRRAVGNFLPAESELEKLFHLSNNSVRKGLAILVQEGLIEKIPRVGNRVIAPSPERTATVKLGIHDTIEREANIAGLLEEFHRRYPHIRVQTVALPTGGYGRFVAECMEAGMLDVVTINNVNYQEMVEDGNGELLELLDAGSDVYPFLAEPFLCDGGTLVKPFIFSPVVLCYNRDHFREKGLFEPDSGWSWEDLCRAARELAVKNKRFGFYCSLLARNRWPVFLLQGGVSFEPDARGEYRLSGTRLIECLEIGRDLLKSPDVFPVMLSASNADAEELFLEEKVSMIMTTYFSLNELKDAPFSFDVAPLPSGREFRTLLVIIGLAVNRKSQVKEAAKLLVDFLTSYEAQLAIRLKTLSIPADRRAAEWQGEERMARPSRFHMYREIVPTFRLLADLRLTVRQIAALQKEVKMFWTGLVDERSLCSRVERALSGVKPEDALQKTT